MAEKGQTRDPSSHRTPGQITRQVKGYNHEPENIKKRVQRDQARAKLMSEGLVKKGDGKDVGHKTPVRNGGSNARSNLRVEARGPNRGWRG